MSRIPYPKVETLSQAKRDVMDHFGSKLLNVSRMAMHAPDAFWAAQRTLGYASLLTKSFDPKLKEYIILCVGYLSNSAYEAFHHEGVARDLGVGEDTLQALRAGDFSSLTRWSAPSASSPPKWCGTFHPATRRLPPCAHSCPMTGYSKSSA